MNKADKRFLFALLLIVIFILGSTEMGKMFLRQTSLLCFVSYLVYQEILSWFDPTPPNSKET